MPLTLLCYHRLGATAPDQTRFEAAFAAEAGCALGELQDGGYRAWRWRDPVTGASAEGDLGPLPLVDDELSQPTVYDDYQALDAAVHLPLGVPHWHCVEGLQMLERVLGRLPELAILNTEDTSQPDRDEPGPGPLRRDAVLACWERLHASQLAELTGRPRMNRLASVALWRYRRERALGAERHPELVWPGALAMQWQRQAVSVAIQPDTDQAWALPPVEVLVIADPVTPVAVPTAELLPTCAHDPLTVAGAVRMPQALRPAELPTGLEPLPAAELGALGDDDWTD